MREVSKGRRKLVEGALEVTRVVRVTYGPRGRTVTLDRPAGILSTRDGVTVACEVEPECPIKRLGARILRQACLSVNDKVGDGTSTTAVIAGSLIEEGLKAIEAGVDPSEFATCVRSLTDYLFSVRDRWQHGNLEPDREMLKELVVSVTKQDTEVAEAIAEAYSIAGKHGLVLIEDGKGVGIEVVPKSGLELSEGWESSDLSTSLEWKAERCLVAVVDARLQSFKDILPLLEAATSVAPGGLPLLIVSQGVFGEALQTLVTNQQKGVLQVCSVKAPGKLIPKMRDWMEDIAALSQATVVSSEAGYDFRKFEASWLGSVQQATVSAKTTTLVCFEDAYDSILNRVAALSRQKDNTDSDHDRDVLDERIAKLTEGLCVLRVGGTSESVAKERRGRIEDGLRAAKAALDFGLTAGAGMNYWTMSLVLEDLEVPADDMVLHAARKALMVAVESPLRTLVENSGYSYDRVEQELLRASYRSDSFLWGFDAVEGKVRILGEHPQILDPISVVDEALESAVSVATTLLTCEIAITGKPHVK